MATATKTVGRKATAEPKNQFDPEKLEAEAQAEAAPSDSDEAAEQDRAEVDTQLADVQGKFEKLRNITAGWRKKMSAAQNKTAKAKAKFDEMDAARKKAKATVDACIADERALMARFTSGEQLLPYDPDEDDQAAKAESNGQATAATVATVGEDEAAASPITVLLGKEIKKIVGADVFNESKGRGEPLGLTDKALDIVAGQGWDTIGKLEKAMRDDSRWFDHLKGFGEGKINSLINTLMAFRRVHPHPEEQSTEEAPAPAANDWNQAVADLDYIVRKSGELIDKGPDEALEFAKSVGIEAVEMRKWIEENQTATDDQMTAIKNWTEGLNAWKTDPEK